MKKTVIPAVPAALGAAAMVLRRLLYVFCVDDTGLLVSGTLLERAVWLLSAAAVGYLLLSIRKLEGSQLYEDNFGPSRRAMAGCFAAAAAMVLAMLGAEPPMPGILGQAWQAAGWLAPVCLVLAGLARNQGKKPFFALHLIPSLFYVLHLVNHYQMWSGNPQLQDYFFAMFSSVAMMFFSYHCAAFAVDAGQRRAQLFAGLAAVYLLAADLGNAMYPWLNLAGLFWAMTDLCSLVPKPKAPSQEEK